MLLLRKNNHCSSIAYTYSEPVVFYEYTFDTSVRAHEEGILNVLVTAGYINEKPLRKLCSVVDAANVDLKGFQDSYYRDICMGTLKPVLDALIVMKAEGIFVEVTNLVVPTLNDDISRIGEMCVWIRDNLGDDTPLHFSRFYPIYRLRNLPLTPVNTLIKARNKAMDSGLKYVYIGNVPQNEGENTICPGCGKIVIKRKGYWIENNAVSNGKCSYCGYKIAGIWG